MKNCPRVECRRVSIRMGAIYKAAYGTLSRRVTCDVCTYIRAANMQKLNFVGGGGGGGGGAFIYICPPNAGCATTPLTTTRLVARSPTSSGTRPTPLLYREYISYIFNKCMMAKTYLFSNTKRYCCIELAPVHCKDDEL